ncbi:hypothetical protein CIP106467_0760 [Citrobacter europaeus]|nr:hypothetical protein CIP106467_0760 [Citrobacter europaeus]
MGFTLLMPDHLFLFTDNSSTLHAIKEPLCFHIIQGLQ